MKISDTVENIYKCKRYYSMLEGMDMMIRKAPDNDKKEMLLDIIKYGKNLTKSFEKFAGSNEYLQAVDWAREGLLDIERRRNKELEIELERFKKGI